MNSLRTLLIASLFAALPMSAQIVVNNVSLPTGTRTAAYGPIQFTANQTGLGWNISAGVLPPGLNLSAQGVLSGTITTLATAPSYTFTVRATPAVGGSSGTRDFTINVVGAPTLTRIAAEDMLPVAFGNVPYSTNLNNHFTIAGGVSPTRYEIVSGPAGFYIDPNGNFLSGAPRVASGTYSFTFVARDANNGSSNSSQISIAVENNVVTALTSSLPNWTVGRPYFAPISAGDGAGFYTWNQVTSSLPTGVAMDPKLACPTLANGTPYQVNRFLQTTAGLSGGPTLHTFSLISGALPPGITLSSTGTLTGSATQSGTFSYVIGARDQSGLGALRGCSLTVTVAGSAALPLASACPMNFANTGSYYNSGITLQNSTTTPTGYQLLTGSLPSGLALSTTTGEISGVPNGAAGTSAFTVRVLRSAGNVDVACSIRQYAESYGVNQSSVYGTPTTTGNFVLNGMVQAEFGGSASFSAGFTINPAPALSSLALPSGTIAQAYSAPSLSTFRTGGTAPFTFALVSGGLPASLNMDSSGQISGSPTSSGTYNFTARVTDAAGATADGNYSIVISNPNNLLQITTASLPVGVVGQPYPTTTFTGSGGTGTGYTWTLQSQFPFYDMSLSSGGVLSGTPSYSGNRSVDIRLQDSSTTQVLRNYTLTVTNFVCPTAGAQINTSYNSAFSFNYFTPTGFAVTSGTLPTGLTLNTTTGVVSGTPTVLGISNYGVTATDSFGRQISRSCGITVQSTVQISSPLSHGRVTVPYRSAIGVTGGNPPYTHSVVSGSLPKGLTFDAATGALTGTPTDPGASTFRVRTQDSTGNIDEQDFTLRMILRDRSPEHRCVLPSAAVGSFYSSAFGTNSTQTPNFQIDSALPPGLNFSPTTGMLTGTPTQSGEYIFYVSAFGSGEEYYETCEIQVAPQAPATLAAACATQRDMLLNDPYAGQVIATGGVRPYTYQLYYTTLPPGLTFNTQTGLLSGTLTALPENYFFTASNSPSNSASAELFYSVRVEDAVGNFTSTSYCYNHVSDTPILKILTLSLPSGIIGGNYSAKVDFTGGVSPYTASLVGSLPAGITYSIVGNSVVFAGSPNTQGTATFRLLLRDASHQLALQDYTINLTTADPLRFTSAVVNGGTVGIGYSSGLDAAGGSPPYRFAVTSGTMAPGLTLNQGGTISGTPTTAGTYRFDAEVTDVAGGRASATFALVVFQGNFRLGCPALSGEIGVPYNSAANVLGGSQPYQFSIGPGTLPPGLTLDPTTGSITGRPTTAGAYIFTFGVSDARQSRTQTQCSIGVVGGSLRIITEGPISTRAGQDYNGQLEAAGGSVPYTWTLLTSAPEAGITVATNGTFTGKATKRGNHTFSVQARDAAGATVNRTLAVAATDSSLALACPAVTSYTIGVSANGQFGLTGGVAPYRVSLFSGNLPPGFTLQTGGAFTIRGTQTGSFPVQIQALDDTNTSVTTRCTFEVTGDPLVITTDALADGTVGQAYSAGVSSRGGVGRVRYGLANGGLPGGLELDPNSGSIGGTPEAEGNFTVGVSATDELRRTTTRALGLRILSGTLPFRITTGSPLSDGLVGRPYSADFGAEGGKAPYTFTIDGVPAGLTASGASISGTPTAAGDATISVSARDANGATAAKSFLLRIKADGLFIITETLPDGVLGQPYTTGVTSQGGRAPFTWSILSGAIPPGVNFNPNNGEFEGSPSASGRFAMTVEVTDATGATSRRSYAFEVRPPGVDRLQITTQSLPNGSAGTAYSGSVGATGGRAPYAWSVNGDLPAGLSFSGSGEITGTPAAVGTRSFVVTVSDSLGLRASRTLSITIGTSAVPGLAIDGLPDTANANQTLPVTLRMASAFPLPVTGRLTLTFVPDTIHNTDDPNIRFGNGSRTLDFTIPAGSTTVNITGVANVNTGTLAGTIRIESTLNFAGTSVPGPTSTILMRRAAPTISAVRLTRTGSGLEVRIEGFTNTRQLAEARITFTAGSNVDFNGAQITVNVASAIQSWFANSASLQFGGQFALTLPFTVNGNPADITSASVVITNGEGASASATAN